MDKDQQIQQLEVARKHVLADPAHYAQIIPGIIPIIGPHAHIDVQRWGAEFLAEGFASPTLSAKSKEDLSVKVLQLLKDLLDAQASDEAVVKSVIQTAASIYGFIFRHITNDPLDSHNWEQMTAIKATILGRWDTASIGIRVCCIKFVQKVIQVQTPGQITDPRRPEQNEISLALVPRDHPVIPPSKLEAEASGLLDRLLNVFQEDGSNAVLIDATLNCLSVLVRSRPSISSKIIGNVLQFNPMKQARASMTPKEKVLVKSMERTTRAFLMNIYRKPEVSSPFQVRIKQHVDHMIALRLEAFDEGSKKRGPPEPTDGLDNAKRARLAPDVNGRENVPPLPPGPVSVAQLYTLTTDAALKSFDVSAIPIDLVVKITMPVLQRIDSEQLDESINAIRARILELGRRDAPQAPELIPTVPAFEDDEEGDDYEPMLEFEPKQDTEQVLNQLDMSPVDTARESNEIALGLFRLPQPPPLAYDEAEKLGKGCISRVFDMMSKLEEPAKAPKPGLNRLAGSRFDREAWITIIARLATRANPEQISGEEHEEDDKARQIDRGGEGLGDGIRQTLWKYIVDDFRHRIDTAIAWLNEEWYNDRVRQLGSKENGMVSTDSPLKGNYERCVLKILDAIIPYLDANDKILVRFLGEIPEVSETVLARIKAMANDPDRVVLTVKAIYYLVAFKPPAKEMALDALEDLWHKHPEARASLRPILAKVRPAVVAAQAANNVKKEGTSTPLPILTATPIPEGGSEAPSKQEGSPKTIAAAS